MVDAAREWIEAQCVERPALAAALSDEAMRKVARRTTNKWRRAWELRVEDLRKTTTIRKQMNRSHITRTCTGMARALVSKHETLSVFLAEPLDGLQRWQGAQRMPAWRLRAAVRARCSC
jgi:hypothetical protein